MRDVFKFTLDSKPRINGPEKQEKPIDADKTHEDISDEPLNDEEIKIVDKNLPKLYSVVRRLSSLARYKKLSEIDDFISIEEINEALIKESLDSNDLSMMAKLPESDQAIGSVYRLLAILENGKDKYDLDSFLYNLLSRSVIFPKPNDKKINSISSISREELAAQRHSIMENSKGKLIKKQLKIKSAVNMTNNSLFHVGKLNLSCPAMR